METLARVAEQVWGLGVRTSLPVTESFGSDVLLFDATDGKRYAVKKSFSPAKGQREIDALSALAWHKQVPLLLDYRLVAGELYLLIEGLDGTPWTSIADTSRELIRPIGAAIGGIHRARYESFDVCDTWHGLLQYNADRYHDTIGQHDRDLAGRARAAFEHELTIVPESTEPVLVHFDLRPGNVLMRGGEFVAVIDFESARGGHPSMDFFKFWQQVEPVVPGALAMLVAGHQSSVQTPTCDSQQDTSWMRVDRLIRLMQTYALYHGLAGLSWCYARDDFSGHFPDTNRGLITSALSSM